MKTVTIIYTVSIFIWLITSGYYIAKDAATGGEYKNNDLFLFISFALLLPAAIFIGVWMVLIMIPITIGKIIFYFVEKYHGNT